MSKPKVLLLDIETAPVLAYVWRLFDENIGLNQIKSDWFILSWAAKWEGSKEIMYADQRNAPKVEDDRKLLNGIWKLLDECDIAIAQNGKRFDAKKLNARFILNGYKPPSSYKIIDTLLIAKKHFGFTSNKLEYLSSQLCSDQKKSKHAKFEGFELWKECLAKNPEAWKEMEKYNKQDVLALEGVYNKLKAWDNTVNFKVFNSACKCGSKKVHRRGYYYTNAGKFQKWRCNDCGHETRSTENLLRGKITRANTVR